MRLIATVKVYLETPLSKLFHFCNFWSIFPTATIYTPVYRGQKVCQYDAGFAVRYSPNFLEY